MDSSFKDTIREHLKLKESNRWIEPSMPLSRYRTGESPVESGAVDQAGLAGQGGILDPDGPSGWPTAENLGLEAPAALWSGTPEFDWGD
jgi:hypothetical protein